MEGKIKIDIVSDVVCPWCLIGYKHLEQAISEMGVQDKVEIEWQPFELNPEMPAEGEDAQAYRTRKYGATAEDSTRAFANMTRLGEEVGFKFDYFDEMKMVNTFDAHVLLDYAKEKGLQTELNLRLVAAFYSERKDISDRKVLSKELDTVGLNVDEAMARLDNEKVREQVVADETRWKNMGITGVPTMIFNKVGSLRGAQPVNTYKQVLAEILELKPTSDFTLIQN